MLFNLSTTINSLYETEIISLRTYNCLMSAGIETLGDITSTYDKPEELMKLKNFGLKSFTEIKSVLQETELSYNPIKPKTKEELFAELGDDVCQIMKSVYDSLFSEVDNIALYFRISYPSVIDIHNAVMGDFGKLIDICPFYSQEDNIKIRNCYKEYIFNVITELHEHHIIYNDVYKAYQDKLILLNDNISKFSLLDILNNFTSPVVDEFLSEIYEGMRESSLSVRAKKFCKKVAPTYKDLVPYFDAPLQDYRNLCPGQNLSKTFSELQSFNLQLKNEIEKYYNKSDEEIKLIKIKIHYPFLSSNQRLFVNTYITDYGVPPLFYLLYNYLRISDNRNEKIFSLRYGIFDGRERSLVEIAEAMSVTNERVRQVLRGGIAAKMLEEPSWQKYSMLWTQPFVTEFSDSYIEIKDKEHLTFDFSIFARFLQLVRSFEIFEVEGKTIAINTDILHNFNFAECIDSLLLLVNSKYLKDTKIRIDDCLNDTPKSIYNQAKSLMILVAKEFLGQEISAHNELVFKKNRVDVSKELYEIIEAKGEPMSVEDILIEYNKRCPSAKIDKVSKVRFYLMRHPKIKALGHTSRYGLITWDHVYFGSIRELIIDLLSSSEEPMHISDIFETVKNIFPDTTIKSITASMRLDQQGRFIAFGEGMYGLENKEYAETYDLANNERSKISFEDRIYSFTEFVKNYNRYPVSNNGIHESSLYKWLYNIQNDIIVLPEAQRAQIDSLLHEYELALIPRNAIEAEFRNNCHNYKDFINKKHCLPTIDNGTDLFKWFKRSKDNYNSFVDHRRQYLTDLFNYILSFGFSLS